MITADNATYLYSSALEAFYGPHDLVKPRGLPTRELRGFQLLLTDANANLIHNRARKLNYGFMVAEWLWILTGCALKDAILPFNRNLSIALTDPADHTFAGAYGPKWGEQLPYVLDSLRSDAESRQAVVNIWRDRPRSSKDTPCTLSWQFFLREGKLELHTHMRSNDVWLGLPYDLFNFTQLQRWMAAELRVEAGAYLHSVGSFHYYEQETTVLLDAAVEDRSSLPLPQVWPRHQPGLALLLELLLSGSRLKDRLNQELDNGIDVERWAHEWTEHLAPYGPSWWVLPAVLLSGHAESRARFAQDGRFRGTSWSTIFREESAP